MAIQFPSQIELNLAAPLDSRQVVADKTARESMQYVYSGLLVYELDSKSLYVAREPVSGGGGFIWQPITGEEAEHIIVKGYLWNGEFYTTSEYLEEKKLAHNTNWIYIDKNNGGNTSYIWNAVKDSETGTTTSYQYMNLNELLNTATDEKAGIMKLYDSSGLNTDGTMTQKSITNGVNSIKFAVDSGDSECLVLDLPWD